MSRTERELVLAREEAARARQQLTQLLVEIQGRLKPSALIEEAVEELREKVEELAQEGIALVKERPAVAAGAVAAVIAWFFRGTLWNVVASAFSRPEATAPAPQELHPGTRRPPSARRNGG